MAEKKSWSEFTKRERVAGISVLVVLGLVVIGLTTGAVNGMNGGGAGSKPDLAGSQPAASQPQTVTKEVNETEPVTFDRTTRDDPTREVGASAVTTLGVDGVRTKTFQVTLVDGKETGRTLLREEVTTASVTEITSVGAKPAYVAPKKAVPATASASCDPNYAGACVPIDSDVDCAGGSGNGPSYVSGPVRVIGTDIYGLDRDVNGIGCES